MSEQLERYRWLVVALMSVPLLSGIGYLLNDRLDDPAPLRVNETQTLPTDIRVYIAGAVQNPGVYPVEEDDRWIDAVEAAGGPTSDANLDAVNLSQRVHDEDQIFVPRLSSTNVAGVSQGPLININTAAAEQLESLPGIGAARTRSILASRTSDGPFATIDDLLSRDLIPESVFTEIAPLITVSE